MVKDTSCWAISRVCSVKSEALSGCVHDQMHDFKRVSVRVYVSLCHSLCEWAGLNTQIRSKTLFTSFKWQFPYEFPFYSNDFLYGSFFLSSISSWFILNMLGCEFKAYLMSKMFAEFEHVWGLFEHISDSLLTGTEYNTILVTICTILKTSDTTENIRPRLSTFRAPGGRTRDTISRRYQKQSISQFHIAFIVPPSLLCA